MKQEQVIELAKKAGASFFPGIGFDVISLDVPKLVALVEQATLERAAKVCTTEVARMTNDLHGTTFYIATGQCAKAIRNLAKEST